LLETFDRAMHGLRIQAEGKDYRIFRIADVLEDSPGSEAGLRPDDVITAINGKSTGDLTLSKLNEMFERHISYKVTVRRGDQTVHVTLIPRKLV
jgi:C-terminal processing protease CtpA/Prc